MLELEPCPFCGGEAHTIRHADFYGIWHGKSGSPCYFSEKELWGFSSEAEAVEAWNTRHERTCLVRCEDCSGFEVIPGTRIPGYRCRYLNKNTQPGEFCSWGFRR